MSLTLTDAQVTQLHSFADFLDSLVGAGSAPGLTWQSQLQQKALAWLSNPANVTISDPSQLAQVESNFKASFPASVQLQSVQVVAVPPAAPGLPPTGLYHVYAGVAVGVPPASTPTPTPTINPDGTGVAGVNPPPGVDGATLIATPAGGSQTGSDGIAYIKHLDQTMFGPSVYWVKQ